MHSIDDLSSALKQHGIRLTPQRMAICKILSDTNRHPTAAMIYEQVKAQYPSLSMMTVYNTLNTLVNLGLVNELGSVGDDQVHYDGNIAPHINLACISCHKIVDITFPHISNLGNEISIKSGYKLLGARMMYYGLCPSCLKQTTKRRKSYE
jgi:Fur family peroxide stress response transcriptional regulator